MSFTTFVDHLLMAAEDDWVGVWELPWLATSVGGASSPEEVMELSLKAIRKALVDGLVEVGDVTELGFQPWGMLPDEACRRIEREWRRFPNGPRLGDISCWFNLTGKGRQHLAMKMHKKGNADRRKPF